MPRRPDPYRKGGPHDDVANNIRNEQMRDAMPSQAEAKAEHRRYLASKGCKYCDEDDPEHLGIEMLFIPSCRAYQAPPDVEGPVVCDEHRMNPKTRWMENRLDALGGNRRAVVFYECDAYAYADMPEFPSSRYNAPDVSRWDDIPPSHRPIPEVPIRCECGADVDDVIYADEVEEIKTDG